MSSQQEDSHGVREGKACQKECEVDEGEVSRVFPHVVERNQGLINTDAMARF